MDILRTFLEQQPLLSMFLVIGLGYALGGPSVQERSETTFGMGGVGGSWAGADTATATSLAVTKNLLTENFDTAARIARIVFA